MSTVKSSSENLTLNADGVGSDVVIQNNGTETVRIDSSGNVGIGTSTVDSALHIEVPNPLVTLEDTTNAFKATINGENGNLVLSSDTAAASGSASYISFEVDATERMRINSSGDLYVGETTGGSGLTSIVRAKGFNTRTGHAGSLGSNIFNINWSSPNAQLWIDTTNIGTFISASDYRIKRNVETQTESALNRIAQLRPVTYQPADYGVAFVASDEIKEGFIAHELAEIIPSAVEGEKDAEDQIQSLKLDALCSVMVKAIQEQQEEINQLKARVEALEAGV